MNIFDQQQQNQQAMYQMMQQQPKSTDPKTWTMGDYWEFRQYVSDSIDKAQARAIDMAVDAVFRLVGKWVSILLGIAFVCGILIRIGMSLR